ncbi:MAG: bifunctional DNA-formamidopyrimidine glycosylase/DNA-(apurinic or apyrimidinic site) lyase [Planctomycetaceae bacterium]
MPELPEVETMRRGIEPIVGSRIGAVTRPPCQRRPIQIHPSVESIDASVRGKRIARIGRRGKRILIEIEDGQVIVVEPRMTGLMLLVEPPTLEHLRLRVELLEGAHEEVLFWDRRGLGTVRLMSAAEAMMVLGESRIGRDALEITADQLRERLARSRRPIKVALLDQKQVAGIGNLYAAEILHLAEVDPRARCDRLTKPQWLRIHAAISVVLQDAILHEGSTLSDGTYRNALNVDGGYQNHHRVYDREGQLCPRCQQGVIRRIVQAQRSTFFCPVCQRKSGRYLG